MTKVHAKLAYHLLLFVYVYTQDVPVDQITVRGKTIELSHRGFIDVHNPDDIEALLTALYNLCDYYNTCNTSITVPDSQRMFLQCCVPCDCSDRCFVVGNCCRDKIGRPEQTHSGEIVSEYGETCSLIHPTDRKDRTFSYLMVSSCPLEYEGEARDMCEKTNQTTLDLLMPVYSNQNGLTYSNTHCGNCNYQNEYLSPWYISVECDLYRPMHPARDRIVTVPNDCGFKWTSERPRTQCYRQTENADCDRAKYQTLCKTALKGYGFIKQLEYQACSSQCSLPLGHSCGTNVPIIVGDHTYEALLNWELYGPIASAQRTKLELNCSDGKSWDDLHVCIQ